jgi:hypothetical protein
MGSNSDSWQQLIVKTGTFNALIFMRMLAKIGHAFAVATRGKDAFTPMLPELILGKNNAARWLIGVDPDAEKLPPHPLPHDLSLEIIKVSTGTYLVAAIRLFASIGMPKYRVVVGQLNRRQLLRLIIKLLTGAHPQWQSLRLIPLLFPGTRTD